MQIFTAALTSTAMLIAALALTGLTGRSLCASRRWQAEIKRVGEDLKDQAFIKYGATCSGPRIHWSFTGVFHDT